MGKLKDRLTITVSAVLLGWRRLSETAYSGVVYQESSGKKEYMSYIEFERVEYYPEMSAFWDEHWVGVKGDVYVAMFKEHRQPANGPMI